MAGHAIPAVQQVSPGLAPLHCRALRNCSLSGGVPAAWSAPGALPALKTLDLSLNRLTGSLPLGWLNTLHHINYVELTGNRLTGPLPTEWASTTLSSLLLDENAFTGTLPGGWPQRFPNIKMLGLQHNQLRGSLPPSWQQFGDLDTMWLHCNQLTGSLPPGLGLGSSLPSLTNLDVSHNQLTGSLPPGHSSGAGGTCSLPSAPSAMEYM